MLQAWPKTTLKAIRRTLRELQNTEQVWAEGIKFDWPKGAKELLSKDKENLIKRLTMLSMNPKDREMVARQVTDHYLKYE